MNILIATFLMNSIFLISPVIASENAALPMAADKGQKPASRPLGTDECGPEMIKAEMDKIKAILKLGKRSMIHI